VRPILGVETVRGLVHGGAGRQERPVTPRNRWGTSYDPIERLDAFLQFNERNILTHAGSVSHELAEQHARTFRARFADYPVRVETLSRFQTPAAAAEKLRKFDIELDPSGRTVKIAGKDVPMTRKEFDLLSVLIGKAGRVLSIPYLLETVWGYDPADYNDPGTVEVHVCHLRKKLGPKLAKRIVAITGHGYKFDG